MVPTIHRTCFKTFKSLQFSILSVMTCMQNMTYVNASIKLKSAFGDQVTVEWLHSWSVQYSKETFPRRSVKPFFHFLMWSVLYLVPVHLSWPEYSIVAPRWRSWFSSAPDFICLVWCTCDVNGLIDWFVTQLCFSPVACLASFCCSASCFMSDEHCCDSCIFMYSHSHYTFVYS